MNDKTDPNFIIRHPGAFDRTIQIKRDNYKCSRDAHGNYWLEFHSLPITVKVGDLLQDGRNTKIILSIHPHFTEGLKEITVRGNGL